MFTYDTKLVGAVHYNSNFQDVSMANPKTGYFTGKWSVNIPSSFEHGTVTCEKDWAYTNETVTLTVIPDEGYSLESLTVATIDDSEPSGTPSKSEIGVTQGEEPGTYTFKMPAAPVTVNAVFSMIVVTGIDDLNADNVNGAMRHYDLNGRYVGTSLEKAPRGIYITSDGRKIVK